MKQKEKTFPPKPLPKEDMLNIRYSIWNELLNENKDYKAKIKKLEKESQD